MATHPFPEIAGQDECQVTMHLPPGVPGSAIGASVLADSGMKYLSTDLWDDYLR